ncbi:MAG TPA: hypothetical protein DEO88_11710, partial [Syntrophobacteraceae bacterium]|nr:hypothetical protein [Syntrophobacteraceae bacterium]
MPDTIKPAQHQEIAWSIEQMQRLDTLADDIHRHIVTTLGNEVHARSKFRYFHGLAYSIRDRLINMWLSTQRTYYDSMVKRVYYLSMEFLPGRFLMNYLTSMGMEQGCQEVLEKLGMALEDLEEVEWDAG